MSPGIPKIQPWNIGMTPPIIPIITSAIPMVILNVSRNIFTNYHENLCFSKEIWSGVAPQQPPITLAPASTAFFIIEKYLSFE